MTSITLEPDMDVRFEALSARSGRSKTDYLREAILRGLEDIEDIEDAEGVLSRLRSGEELTVPLEDVMQRLGLDS